MHELSVTLLIADTNHAMKELNAMAALSCLDGFGTEEPLCKRVALAATVLNQETHRVICTAARPSYIPDRRSGSGTSLQDHRLRNSIIYSTMDRT